jgi:K+-transporting ATPase ATPase C chain
VRWDWYKFKQMKIIFLGQQLRIAVILLFLFTILLGIIYPLTVTGIAQVAFPRQSNGSLIEKDGVIIGSELIGQPVSNPAYFWGRLSATEPPYNASASSGSNYGPLNPALLTAVQTRIAALKSLDPDNQQPIPVDLVTYSASGLDPHISVASANYQVSRIARYRRISEEQLYSMVDRFTEKRQLGVLGEPRVNVLRLNLALDELK